MCFVQHYLRNNRHQRLLKAGISNPPTIWEPQLFFLPSQEALCVPQMTVGYCWHKFASKAFIDDKDSTLSDMNRIAKKARGRTMAASRP